VQEKFTTLRQHKLKIKYLESPKNSTRTYQDPEQHILFIHGLGSSAERWLDLPDALSLYFHTIAIDLPGFGGSDKLSDKEYTIEAFSNILIDFIDTIGIAEENHHKNNNRTITLVGHSLGGYVASKIAVMPTSSNFLHKLILIDSSGNLERPTDLLEQYLDAAMNPSREKVRNVFEQMVANPLIINDALVQGFINRVNNPDSKYAFESSLRNSANTQIGVENLHKISEKGVTSLIMWGTHDRVIPIEHSQIFKEAIKGSSVIIIPETGHAPFTEKPALVCEYLHRFLVDK
jgi:2-hydroxy-6-oxonona-2,4-dienedioate hydrolase